MIREAHSSALLATTQAPIKYLVDGFLPLGAFGDVSGPPGDGKSTILLSLAAHVSTGDIWYGYKTQQTPVAWVSGEASGEDAIARDLHRLKISPAADVLFMLPEDPLFRFDRQSACWITTADGGSVLQRCRDSGVGMLFIDTIGSCCAGLVEIDNDQQRQLARHIRRETAGMTAICISHTNQSSSKEALDRRLHYLSRAGGNGFPGAVRWAAGVSRLQVEDEKKLGGRVTLSDIESAKLVAFGVSKSNEMPQPAANNFTPMVFEITKSGELRLIADASVIGMHQRGSAAPSAPPALSGRGVERGTYANLDF